jgi:hypothetical protein
MSSGKGNKYISLAKLVESILPKAKITNYNEEVFDDGNGRFISMMNGDITLAATYHEYKWHKAKARNGFNKEAHSNAPPHEWAITWVSQTLFGNKTSYSFD